MKINQITENAGSTTAGSVAPVEHAFVKMQTRNPSVYGDTKTGSLFKGKKTNKPFANSISEGTEERKRNRQMSMASDYETRAKQTKNDIKKQQYLKMAADIRRGIKTTEEEPVSEAKLDEDDIILIPGQGNMYKPGFHKIDPDKAEHEGQTLKNSLRTIIRVATALDKQLSTQDNFPEWVSEKIGAVKSNMVNVMDYLISAKEMQAEPDAFENVGGSPEANKALIKMSMNRDDISQQAIGGNGAITNGAQGESKMHEDVVSYDSKGYWDVNLWGNWYGGKWFDYGPRKVAVPGTTEQEAMDWVKNHADEIYAYYAGRKFYNGKRMLPKPVQKNLFLDRTKPIGPSQSYRVPPEQQGVEEGAKVDRMVKHVAQSEKKLGHSAKEAENIAWATANKRGMLDNKNKKK